MTKQLLFRGQAQETVNKDAEKNTKAMYKAMAKMFKDFPPSGGEVVLPARPERRAAQ